jgi:hypothetical protein
MFISIPVEARKLYNHCMNEITIADKIYISSKRAAEITGYAKDYVGQLCREGHVEAKMVGRSWYVYEPSIRAHRFGTSIEAEQVKPEAVEEAVVDEEKALDKGWEKAKYTSEVPEMIPQVETPAYKELLPPAEESLVDMQTAWKEWFERKQNGNDEPIAPIAAYPDAEDEEESVEEESEVEDEVEIPLHHIEEAVEEERAPDEEPEPIAIHPIQRPEVAYTGPQVPSPRYVEPARYSVERREEQLQPGGKIIEERIVMPRKQKRRTKTRSHTPVMILLVVISVTAAAVAVIGTGIAERYTSSLDNENAAIKFIVGTREFKR